MFKRSFWLPYREWIRQKQRKLVRSLFHQQARVDAGLDWRGSFWSRKAGWIQNAFWMGLTTAERLERPYIVVISVGSKIGP